MRKKIILSTVFIFSLILLSKNVAFSQLEKAQKVVSAGLAYSSYNFYSYGSNSRTLSDKFNVTPVINAMFDYGLSDELDIGSYGTYLSFGGAFAYQHIDHYYRKYSSPLVLERFTDKYERINVAMRLMLHEDYNEGDSNLDIYGGLRLGFTFWDYRPGVFGGYDNGKVVIFNQNNNIKFQAVAGFRYYFSDCWGLNGEVALGIPYFANLGVSYKIMSLTDLSKKGK